jgi:hypothetical protein
VARDLAGSESVDAQRKIESRADMHTLPTQNVNRTSTGHDGRNGITLPEWIHAVLHSGEVTRIGQHLALVLYFLTDAETNVAKVSARDLEKITGWGRTAIIDHLSELEIFIRVTWGRGRAKSQFDLQGVIANVVSEEISGREADIRTAVRKIAIVRPTRISVRETDTTDVVAVQTDAKADTKTDTTVSVRVAVATADTKPPPTKEKSPHTPLKENNNIYNNPLSTWAAREDDKKLDFVNGQVTLFNGLRQFWLEQFGNDGERLDLALIEVADQIQPNSMRPIEAQVGARLARIAAEKRDRDKRYQEAAQRNQAQRPSVGQQPGKKSFATRMLQKSKGVQS